MLNENIFISDSSFFEDIRYNCLNSLLDWALNPVPQTNH